MRYTATILWILLCVSNITTHATSAQKTSISRLSDAEKRKFSYYYFEAIRLRENEKYDEALENFQMCLSIDSLSAATYSELSTMYLNIGLRTESIKYMEKAVSLEPNNWWYVQQLLTMLSEPQFYNKNETEILKANLIKAVEITKTYSHKFPKREEILRLQASLYTKLEKTSDALDAYNKLEKISGVNYEISLMKFRLLAQQGKIDAAMKELDELIRKHPEEPYYKITKGDAYLSLNQANKAFEIYQQIYRIDPNNPYILVSLSNYYKLMKMESKARDFIVLALKNEDLDYKQKTSILADYVENYMKDSTKLGETESLFKLLVEKYPMEEEVHSYYSAFLMIQKRNREASSELETMLSINPHNQSTWLRIIDLNLSTNDTLSIINNTTKAINEFPKEPVWYYYRGLAYRMQKKYDSIIDDYQEGLTLVGETGYKITSDFYAGIAEAYYEKKDYEKTFSYFDKSIIADPTNTMTLNNFAYYLSEQKKDLRKAEKMSAKTVENDPKNSTFLDTYAWIFYQQANYSLAKYYIERAIDNLPKNSDENGAVLYEHYGDILWMLRGHDDEALEMWKKSFELDKSSKNVELKKKIENKGWKRE
jgi:tetratricopeptide (TPR) repeat protein